MHINSDRLIELLTEVELLHIENCSMCRSEREKLMALKIAANQLTLIQPPEQTWDALQSNYSSPVSKKTHVKQWLFSSAASMFFVAVGWLMWSNSQLQNQLEEILLVNMMLEDKINYGQKATYQQATFVKALRELDLTLYQAKTTEEKINVLLKKRVTIQQHLSKPKGDDYEFSI